MAQDTEGREILKSSIALSFMTIISRILGLVREMTRANLTGTGGMAEAFTVAFNIPNFFRKLFAEGSVNAAFVPTIKGYLNRDDRDELREFVSATFTVLLLSVSLVTLLGILGADWIVRLFGSDPGETAVLTRILFPFLVLVSLAALFQGMLNSKKIFTPSGLAPILFNLCFIFLPYLFNIWVHNQARSMAYAVVVGGFFQAVCQLPAVLRSGYGFSLIPLRRALGNPGTRKVLYLIGPTILGVAAYELNSMVSVSLASLNKASTALYLSLRLQELILGIFVVSVSTVILPVLAGKAREGDWSGFNDRLSKSIDSVTLITVPIAVLCLFEGRDIVALLFKSGAFGQDSVALTSGAFFYHSLGLFFIGQNRILAPAFYAREDTKLPTLAGMVNVLVNIALACTLSIFMHGMGIALALSVSSAVNTAMLVIFYLRKEHTDRSAFAKSALYALRILGFSAVAALALRLLSPAVHGLFAESTSRLAAFGLPFVILSSVFGAVGILLLVLSGDRNLGAILSRFRRRR